MWQSADTRPTYLLEVAAIPDARLFSTIERAIGQEDGLLLRGSVDDPAQPVADGEPVRANFAVQIAGERQLSRLLRALRGLPAVSAVTARLAEVEAG